MTNSKFWLVFALVLVVSVGVRAQTISVTAPLSTVTVNEGDDFATKEVGERWDMDNLRDIPFDVGFSQPSVANGVWTGVSLDAGAYFFPLFRAYSSEGYTNYYSYYDNGIPYGPLNPVGAATYSSLSFRTSMAQAERSNINIFWTKHPNYSEHVQANMVAFNDGDKAHTVQLHNPDGFRVYDIDLTVQNMFRERVQPGADTMFDAPVTAGTWSDTVYGFFMNLSAEAAAGTEQKIDWIRLYDPSTSPQVEITWETTGMPVEDNNYTVELYVDTQSSGYNGDLVMTGIVNDGSYTFYTAALPPGTYYIYLKAVHRGADSIDEIARSQYAGPVKITAAPSFDFLAPSFTSGMDYAATELRQAWDMSSEAVLDRSYHISNISFADGIMTGAADAPAPGTTESDAQIWLNTKSLGQDVPVDTSIYRYLTVRMNVDTTGYTNIYDRIYRGWVGRAAWAESDWQGDGTVTKDIPLLEGWHDYSMDLWDDTLVESAGNLSNMSQRGWTNISSATIIRWDPLEVPVATAFQIDYVKLCSVNLPENNTYTIRWNALDTDSDSLSVELYYGYYSGGAYHEEQTPLATVNQSPGVNSYTWDVRGLAAREYYIRAVVSDGSNSVSRMSKVPVLIPSGSALTPYVRDGLGADMDVSTSTTLSFNWGNFYHSSLSYYKVAVGTTSNATDVLAWTSWTNTTYTWDGEMTPGKSYFCSVKGVDTTGETVIEAVSSDGVTCAGDKLVPIYRLYSVGTEESTGEHLFTMNKDEHDALDSWPSWESEGIGWYSFPTEEGDTDPLYRLYNKPWRQHLTTTDWNEYVILSGNTDIWNAEGIQYYVFKEHRPGAIPAYRFYHDGIKSHHFTVNPLEVDAIISNPDWGYAYEGVGFYVFSSDQDQ